LRSSMSSSDVSCLILAFIDISLKSRGEYIVPPPLNAVLMDAWVSRQDALCLLMNYLLWVLQSLAKWVQESGSLHSGHASVGACLYRYVNFLLYSWPYMNLSNVMPSLGKFRM
jgi:hypothetical protein